MNSIQPTTNAMNMETKPQREGGHISSSSRSRRLATTILALTILGPIVAFAQIPARFYWKSLAGGNAVPIIYQSFSGNAIPTDPADFVSGNASIDANIAMVGYAKMLPVFDRTLTLAVLETVGRVSGNTTIAGKSYNQTANGFGDPMLEVGYNVIGPKAIMNIPDMLRYQPGFSLDVIADVVFPIGEYQNNQALNLGMNRWYGRVGAPIIYQIGEWVPGRRTTFEVFPSVWFFADNSDYVGQTLSTDPKLQLEAHLTRDFTETLWGSLDTTYLAGGKSSLNGVAGDSLDSLAAGFTLGYQINDNLSLTAGYMATVNDSKPSDLKLDVFRISITYGWHPLVQGMNRLKKE
jgi:hypothetical protein